MTLCSFIILNVSLLLECAEKLSTFACPVGVKGDCKTKDAKQKMPFCKNPSQDIVESGKDGVGYKLNNSYQSMRGAEQNKAEDSGTINNHILRYEDGGQGR